MTEEDEYLYHSFPRRFKESEKEMDKKALLILSSIVQNGLILTPEKTEWFEWNEDGRKSKPIISFQKRICFTHLNNLEIENHSSFFGQYSLGFKISKMRALGITPVFYLPVSNVENGFEAIGSSIVARLADIQELLTKLDNLSKLADSTTNDNELINFTFNGNIYHNSEFTIKAAKEFLKFLSFGSNKPDFLLSAIRGISGLFYPIENLNYTTQLGYYKQKEWRILGNIIYKGESLTQKPTEDQKIFFCNIDNKFFGNKTKFPSGVDSVVNQCQLLYKINNKHILSYADKIIVPKRSNLRVKEILKEFPNIIVESR